LKSDWKAYGPLVRDDLFSHLHFLKGRDMPVSCRWSVTIEKYENIFIYYGGAMVPAHIATIVPDLRAA
jgi:hypothetical protein